MAKLNTKRLSKEDRAFLALMEGIVTRAQAAKLGFSGEHRTAFETIEAVTAKVCAAVLSKPDA